MVDHTQGNLIQVGIWTPLSQSQRNCIRVIPGNHIKSIIHLFDITEKIIYVNIYLRNMNRVYNEMMKTSRQKVFEYIHSHGIASAADVSQALKMTQANARHHIHILLSQGLLEPAGVRKPAKKGRPGQTYRISQQALGDNLPLLCQTVLIYLREQLGDEQYQQSFEIFATKIARNATQNFSETPQTTPLAQRLVTAINTLNQLNYQARWEAHRSGPLIFFNRCPYQKIIHQHPELCQMDLFLLRKISFASIEQTHRLAKDPTGVSFCRFRVIQN